MAKNNVKTSKKTGKKPFFLIRWVKSFVSLLKGVNVELKKVAWPTKKELVQYTTIVLVVVSMVTVFVWVLDISLGYLRSLV